MLRKAGFFRELRHGDRDGPSLADATADGGGSAEHTNAAAYLQRGAVLATTGMHVDDVLDPSNREIAELAILTDGTWVWPGDLAYYVHRYGATLPDEFVRHMESQDWLPPPLTDADLRGLESQLPPISSPR
jgi:hypothetical protein